MNNRRVILVFMFLWLAVPNYPSHSLDTLYSVSNKLWQVDETHVIQNDAPVLLLTWNPYKNFLAGVEEKDLIQRVKVWNIDTENVEVTFTPDQNAVYSITALEWHPDGNLLAIGYDSLEIDYIEILDVITWQTQQIDIDMRVRTMAWSPDGKSFAVSSIESVISKADISIWDRSGSLIQDHTFSIEETDDFVFLAWGDSFLAAVTWQGHILILDPKTFEEITHERGAMWLLDWQSLGKNLAGAVCSRINGICQLWVWENPAPNTSLTLVDKPEDGIGYLYSLAWHPSLELILGADGNGIMLWNLENGDFSFIFESTDDIEVLSVDWNFDGTLIAGSLDDGTIHIWETLFETPN
jgi:WD40 repeat protein